MQYTFFINQKRLYELGLDKQLDVIDLLLFDAIYKWFNNEELLRIANGTTYIEIRHNLITRECPILGINHRDTFRKRMLKLVSTGLLERYQNNQTENTSLYKRGKLFNCFDSDKGVQIEIGNLPMQIDRGADCNRQGVATQIGTNNIQNNNIQSNKSILSDSKLSDCNKQVYYSSIGNKATAEKLKWLVEYWNTNAVPKGYSKLTGITGKRLTLVHARLKEYGKEQFMQAIDKACQSNFLKGQNSRGFLLTFDWLIKPSNFPKVLEGNYDNKDNLQITNHNGTNANKTDHRTGSDNAERKPYSRVQELGRTKFNLESLSW